MQHATFAIFIFYLETMRNAYLISYILYILIYIIYKIKYNITYSYPFVHIEIIKCCMLHVACCAGTSQKTYKWINVSSRLMILSKSVFKSNVRI